MYSRTVMSRLVAKFCSFCILVSISLIFRSSSVFLIKPRVLGILFSICVIFASQSVFLLNQQYQVFQFQFTKYLYHNQFFFASTLLDILFSISVIFACYHSFFTIPLVVVIFYYYVHPFFRDVCLSESYFDLLINPVVLGILFSLPPVFILIENIIFLTITFLCATSLRFLKVH